MISYLWLIPAFFVGALFGVLIMAICAADKPD